MPFVLVGNKCDLDEARREVSRSRAKDRAQIWDVSYIETSAISGFNLNKLFCDFIRDIQSRRYAKINEILDNKDTKDSDQRPIEHGCCKGCVFL